MSFSLATYITEYDGEKIGNGQCVAEMRRFLKEYTGNAFYGIPNVVDAEDVWDVVDLSKWAKHGRASGYIPKRNALVVIRGHAGQEHGHVCHTRDGSNANYWYTFDQNWSHRLRCSRERHRVDSMILGCLVKK